MSTICGHCNCGAIKATIPKPDGSILCRESPWPLSHPAHSSHHGRVRLHPLSPGFRRDVSLQFPICLHDHLRLTPHHYRATANYFVDPKDLDVEGSPKAYNDRGISGEAVTRNFCGECGSYVPLRPINPPLLGTLPDTTSVVDVSPPVRAVYTAMSAMPSIVSVKAGQSREARLREQGKAKRWS